MVMETGMVNEEELINKILSLESLYSNKIPDNFTRPFQSELAPLIAQTREERIPYDEDKLGTCQICWRGPAGSAVYIQRALRLPIQYMKRYLVQNLIDVKYPFCSVRTNFCGMCKICWRGPDGTAVYIQRALRILIKYMKFYLVQDLVDAKYPFCASLELTFAVRKECLTCSRN
uniref:Uncharacterized protein n=1 Tax=Meloidogyne floridensis TaxID=298350 RepID=A0A915NS92_9BILA